ncbi:MAG TPA: hypothetical protein VFS40_00630, partial [Gemmatimonadales bacterium]|nr:hypothetical protein [Gemmatimonadales bacterium]
MTAPCCASPLRPLVRRLDHATDALALFRALTQDGRRPHTLLLESADPERRSVRRSVLVLSAALSVTCRGDRVTLAPLHADGARLLSLLTDRLTERLAQHACECETLGTGELVLRCPRPPMHATDRDRLRAPSVLTPLRELLGCLATEPSEPPEAICLPGLFAYDLVEQFEHLPPRPATDADVPDYRVYLADRLVVVDHQARRTEVIALAAGGADAA